MKTERKEFNLKGHKLVIRTAVKEDAETLIPYIPRFYKESKYLTKEAEEVSVTLEEEYEWIDEHLDSNNSLLILAELDGKYVGDASFEGTSLLRQKHRVSLGIYLLKEYTNIGIGTLLMKTLIDEAKKTDIEQIELICINDNSIAMHLYQKLGFKVTGTITKYNKYKDGTYVDASYMILDLK